MTNSGSIVGAIIMIIRLGLFVAFTGYLANAFYLLRSPRPRLARTTARAFTGGDPSAVGGVGDSK